MLQMFQIINPGGWQKVFQYKGKKVISKVHYIQCALIELVQQICSITVQCNVTVDENKYCIEVIAALLLGETWVIFLLLKQLDMV